MTYSSGPAPEFSCGISGRPATHIVRTFKSNTPLLRRAAAIVGNRRDIRDAAVVERSMHVRDGIEHVLASLLGLLRRSGGVLSRSFLISHVLCLARRRI